MFSTNGGGCDFPEAEEDGSLRNEGGNVVVECNCANKRARTGSVAVKEEPAIPAFEGVIPGECNGVLWYTLNSVWVLYASLKHVVAYTFANEVGFPVAYELEN